MEWQDLGPARTRLVQDRLDEATWRDHDYIAELLRIERAVLNLGDPSRRRAYAAVQYPLEASAIREEVATGHGVAPEIFRAQRQSRGDLARLSAAERERDEAEVERDWWGQVTRLKRRERSTTP